MTVNDTTNSLSTKIIFGNNRKPQSEFNYRDLAKPVGSDQYNEYRCKFGEDYKFRVFDACGLPVYRDYVPGECYLMVGVFYHSSQAISLSMVSLRI